MSDNVNVLIEKMNQESLKKRKAGGALGGTAARRGGGVSNAGGSSMLGDDLVYDEQGRPVQGGVGVGLVPGNLPNKGYGGGQSNAGGSVAN